MTKSKTKIKKQIERKTDSELAEIISSAMNHPKWKLLSEILFGPRKNRVNINIGDLYKVK